MATPIPVQQPYGYPQQPYGYQQQAVPVFARGKAAALDSFLAQGGVAFKSSRRFKKGKLKGKTVDEAKQMFETMWANAPDSVKEKYASRSQKTDLAPSERAAQAEYEKRNPQMQGGFRPPVNPPSQAQAGSERSNIVQAGSERSNIVQAGSERSNIVQAGSERSNIRQTDRRNMDYRPERDGVVQDIAQAGSPAGEAEDTPTFEELTNIPQSERQLIGEDINNDGTVSGQDGAGPVDSNNQPTADTGDGGMAAAVAMEESQAVDPYAGFKQETTYGPDGNQRPPLEGVQGKEIEALTKKSTPPINYSVEEAASINEINRNIGSNTGVSPGMQSAPEEVTPQLPPTPRTMVEGQAAPPEIRPEQQNATIPVPNQPPAVSAPQGIVPTAPSTPNGFTPAATVNPTPTGAPVMARPDPIKQTLKDGTTVMRQADNAVRDSNNQKVRVNSLTGLPFGFRPGDALPSGADATMQGRAGDSAIRQGNATIGAALDGTLGQREMPVQKPLMPRGPASQREEISRGRSDGYEARGVQEQMDRDRDQAEAFRTGKMGDFKRANGMAPTHSTYQSLADKAAGMPVPDGNRTAGQQKQAEAAQYQKQRETLYGASAVQPPAGVQANRTKRPQIGTSVFAPSFRK
jgi:hypothetical protein